MIGVYARIRVDANCLTQQAAYQTQVHANEGGKLELNLMIISWF
jgi:hypothetical protein